MCKGCRAYGTLAADVIAYPALHAGLDYGVRFADSLPEPTQRMPQGLVLLASNELRGDAAHRFMCKGCRAYGTLAADVIANPALHAGLDYGVRFADSQYE